MLFLSFIICTINGEALQNHVIGGIWRNGHLQKCVRLIPFSSLDSCYFPKKFATHIQKGLIYMSMEKAFL